MSTVRANAILDTSGGTTATINGYTPTVSNMPGLNRIINGAMMIDQRNGGASVTAGSGNVYSLDRWKMLYSVDNKFTVQQQPNPTGVSFSAVAQITSSSAYAVGAGDIFGVQQIIEGYNVADLKWGTADAAAITLSFWVNCSLTGTFGGSVVNNGGTRSYIFTYTVSAANTWEYKTVTIPGDTTGTWLSTNGIGLILSFALGGGSTYSGTAGSWAAANKYTATGAVSVVGTSGATFYITGVQLERGSSATPFEVRQYGTELALCQRYYWRVSHPFFSANYAPYTAGVQVSEIVACPVDMRTTPTATINQTGMNIVGLNALSAPAGMSPKSIKYGSTATAASGNAYWTSVAGNYIDASAEL